MLLVARWWTGSRARSSHH